MDVVSVPPHAISSIQHGVCSLTILQLVFVDYHNLIREQDKEVASQRQWTLHLSA